MMDLLLLKKKQGAYISRSDLTEGVLRHKFGELNIFGEAYTWRSLFSQFYGMLTSVIKISRGSRPSHKGRGKGSVIQTLRKGGSVSDKTFSAL